MPQVICHKVDLVCVEGFFMPYRFATELGGKSSRTQQKGECGSKDSGGALHEVAPGQGIC